MIRPEPGLLLLYNYNFDANTLMSELSMMSYFQHFLMQTAQLPLMAKLGYQELLDG